MISCSFSSVWVLFSSASHSLLYHCFPESLSSVSLRLQLQPLLHNTRVPLLPGSPPRPSPPLREGNNLGAEWQWPSCLWWNHPTSDIMKLQWSCGRRCILQNPANVTRRGIQRKRPGIPREISRSEGYPPCSLCGRFRKGSELCAEPGTGGRGVAAPGAGVGVCRTD